MTRSPLLLLLAAVALLGCPPVYFSSPEGLFTFQTATTSTDDDDSAAEGAPGIYVEPWYGFRNEGPILAGTTLCWLVEPAPGSGFGGDVWPSCFEQAWDGDVVVDGRCHTFSEGDSSFEVVPREECPGAGNAVLAGDVVEFTTVPPDSVELILPRYPEQAAAALGVAASDTPWPVGWPEPYESPLRVVAGEPVLLHAYLVHPDFSHGVAFNSDDATFTVETVEGDDAELVDLFHDPSAVPDEGPYSPAVRLILTEGSRVRFRLDLGGSSWTTGEILGVPESAIESLRVVPAFAAPIEIEEGESGEVEENPSLARGLPQAPFGARALALDADGHEILGADVSWAVGGVTIRLIPGTHPGPQSYFPLPGKDYVWLSDTCLAPEQGAGQRRSTLKASLGELSDKITMNWDRPQADIDPEYERPEDCVGGCSCDAAGAAGGGSMLALGLAVVAGAMRRRGRDR